MPNEKMMNEFKFAKLVKELNSLGETIRTRQEEKQAVLNEYEKEVKRHKTGRISKDTVIASSKSANKELQRLDLSIRTLIQRENKLLVSMREFIGKQAPTPLKATTKGAVSSRKKKKVAPKKKAPKRKK